MFISIKQTFDNDINTDIFFSMNLKTLCKHCFLVDLNRIDMKIISWKFTIQEIIDFNCINIYKQKGPIMWNCGRSDIHPFEVLYSFKKAYPFQEERFTILKIRKVMISLKKWNLFHTKRTSLFLMRTWLLGYVKRLPKIFLISLPFQFPLTHSPGSEKPRRY